MLAACWSRGRIYAFHFERSGFTFKGTPEVILEGRPLNVTDLVVDARVEPTEASDHRAVVFDLQRRR